MIEARIIADSISPLGKRIITFICLYPRFILAEINTHRVLSRNSASSRAIPVEKMIARILKEPAIPITWGKNQKGMQADANVDVETSAKARLVWCNAMQNAVDSSREMLELGIHKQIANRLTEPFAHMTTIITATEWGNFFNLRAHKEAQPEFQELAYAMLEAYVASTPKQLQVGEWHLPFMDAYIDHIPGDIESCLKISTARCARVSYVNFEGFIEPEKDYKLHDDLLTNGHASPFEHCGRAEASLVRSGNIVGYTQYRKLLPNECRSEFDPHALLANRKGKNAENNYLA